MAPPHRLGAGAANHRVSRSLRASRQRSLDDIFTTDSASGCRIPHTIVAGVLWLVTAG
jgi:hypothetical protein